MLGLILAAAAAIGGPGGHRCDSPDNHSYYVADVVYTSTPSYPHVLKLYLERDRKGGKLEFFLFDPRQSWDTAKPDADLATLAAIALNRLRDEHLGVEPKVVSSGSGPIRSNARGPLNKRDSDEVPVYLLTQLSIGAIPAKCTE